MKTIKNAYALSDCTIVVLDTGDIEFIRGEDSFTIRAEDIPNFTASMMNIAYRYQSLYFPPIRRPDEVCNHHA